MKTINTIYSVWVEKVGPYRPCPNNTPCSLGLVCLFWSTHPYYGVCIIPCLSPDCVPSVHPCLPCLKSREVLCCICCLHSGHHCWVPHCGDSASGWVKSGMVLAFQAGIKRLNHSEMTLYIGETYGDKLVALTRTGYMIIM